MNSFGQIFRVSVFGESHGPAIGVMVDGCPPGVPLEAADFIADLSRRKSGITGTTPRREPDIPEILSGIYNGHTTGSPIVLMTRNTNKISSDYTIFGDVPRPGHADFTAGFKYSGYSDPRGSGHFSGRITWGLVVAGAIAKKIINPAEVSAKLISAGGSDNIAAVVEKAVREGDTIGGLIECIIRKPPKGIGEPFFFSFESVLSHIVFSIPGVKGIEFGAGFSAVAMKGSEHNDPFISRQGKTATNNAGGINGGITNGNDVLFRVAVKPTSSTGVEQETLNFKTGKMTKLLIQGRHDTCIALRIPVIVEAAAAIALADLMLIDKAICGPRDH